MMTGYVTKINQENVVEKQNLSSEAEVLSLEMILQTIYILIIH